MDTWLIVLISIGAPLVYFLGFGFAWVLLKTPMDEDFEYMCVGSAFWPVCLTISAGIYLANRMRRPKLPRAIIR